MAARPFRTARLRRKGLGFRWVKGLALSRSLALTLTLALTLMGCGVFPKLTVIPDPLTPEERYQLGQTYEAQGKMDLAEREYQAARPYSKAYLALGNLYFSRQDPESRQKAALNYQKALTQGPAPAAANNLAWLYLQEGRLLGPAETLAVRAILEGVAAKLPAAEIDTFKDTLYEIRKAKRAGKEGL